MNKIRKIARTELQALFYSPIAWLILIIFTVQTGMVFMESFGHTLQSTMLGYHFPGLTTWIFTFPFQGMQGYLYAYIPLLTMGLVSRELNSGSIKLLYSSPVTDTQIILGKFLAMMVYGLIMIGVMVLFAVFGLMTIPHMDVPVVLVALLGTYLLICAYSAIGLFMSCLSSYQVVAAVGTFAVLAVLNYIGHVWQGIAFVRDITFWFSMSGRTNGLLYGYINSEDILYFIIVICMFLAFSILKLQSTKNNKSGAINASRFAAAAAVAIVLGYLSSRPSLMAFYDASCTKSNTITPNSQAIVKKLKGTLTVTTYVNLFENNYYQGMPDNLNYDKENFNPYTRFKPDIDFKYVYYYHSNDNPSSYLDTTKWKTDKEKLNHICTVLDLNPKMFLSPEEIGKKINLAPERYRFVRQLETEDGHKTFLRIFDDIYKQPGEREITAAIKRLVMKLPKVGFLSGQGERDIHDIGDRGYYNLTTNVTSRVALINQGFDVQDVDLSGNNQIPGDINILVIAEARKAFSPAEANKIRQYIDRGGNLFILGAPGRQDVMNPLVQQFGVWFMPGQLVAQNGKYQSQPNLIFAKPTTVARNFNVMFKDFNDAEHSNVAMLGTTGLSYTQDSGYHIQPLFVSDSAGSWNEVETTNFTDDSVVFNPGAGEQEKSFPAIIALSRKVNNRDQKIIISGNADCLSNYELGAGRKGVNSMNYSMVYGIFYWMSNGEVPIDITRPTMPDGQFNLTLSGFSMAKTFFLWILPGALLIFGTILLIRRKRK